IVSPRYSPPSAPDQGGKPCRNTPAYVRRIARPIPAPGSESARGSGDGYCCGLAILVKTSQNTCRGAGEDLEEKVPAMPRQISFPQKKHIPSPRCLQTP